MTLFKVKGEKKRKEKVDVLFFVLLYMCIFLYVYQSSSCRYLSKENLTKPKKTKKKKTQVPPTTQ